MTVDSDMNEKTDENVITANIDAAAKKKENVLEIAGRSARKKTEPAEHRNPVVLNQSDMNVCSPHCS